MQEEVNEKTISLCIKGGKITAQILKAALIKLLAEMDKKKQRGKGEKSQCKKTGRQSIKSLQKSGAQITNIVVTDNNIKSFDRVARKYGIDYSLKKVEQEGKTEYLVFFKAKDVDVMTAAFKEEQNFSTLLEFINASEAREDDENFKNAVDELFEELEKDKPEHFAVRQYKKYKLAAGKTAKSILISCGARLAPFDIAELRDLMAYDEMELDLLGDRRTALFVIISDTDDTFNFVIIWKLVQAVQPPFIYEDVLVTVCCQGQNFTAKYRNVLQPGYMVKPVPFVEPEKNKDVPFPKKMEQGMVLPVVRAEKKQSFTSPPKVYTEDTLLSAMETAGNKEFEKDTEKKGLGTPATRAAILEKLVSSGYVERKGKQMIPTEDGVAAIRNIPDYLKSASMTAEWENDLLRMERGEIKSHDFMQGIHGLLDKILADLRQIPTVAAAPYYNKVSVGSCPVCGNPVHESKLSFCCADRSCKFVLWKESRYLSNIGHQIPEKLLKALIMDQLHLFIVQLSDKRKVLKELQKFEDVQNPVYRAKGEIMSLTDKVSQMAKKREQLYADYVAGVVDSEDYQLIREDYSRQYDGLRAALQEAENKKTEVERQIEEYMNMTSHLEEHLDNFEFDIQLVKSLVQKIEVSADKRIRIVFGFQDVFTELGKESAET